jgi:cobalt/nickel transport system permease protein
MHMADALLSPAVGASFWAGTFAAIGYASKKLKRSIDDRMIPLMGVLGAFIFAAQMINFTIPGTGSSGHIGGGMILAILLGPYAAFLVMASVLTVQALFFADGGLLALGCNIWNLGLYPCFIAYPLLYRPLAGDGRDPKRNLAAALVGAVAGLQMGALSVILETLLSGKTELPLGAFVILMLTIHLAIGIVEGLVTSGVVKYVRSVRPELLESAALSRPLQQSLSIRRVLVVFALLAVIAAGGLSWFASTHPDGLEWAVEKVTGGRGVEASGQGVAGALQKAQEHTAFLPAYQFKQETGEGKRGTDGPAQQAAAGTSVAGIVGAAIVLLLSLAVGFTVRLLRSRRKHA